MLGMNGVLSICVCIARANCLVMLGPTVMGHIPGYMDTIFPTASMPILNMAANLGLVLFLFLVGLEVDMRILASNWRTAASVGTLGMALPFGLGLYSNHSVSGDFLMTCVLGAGIAYGLYHEFKNDEGILHIKFGVYLLFIGVAMAITVLDQTDAV